jgi:hypothetical protein
MGFWIVNWYALSWAATIHYMAWNTLLEYGHNEARLGGPTAVVPRGQHHDEAQATRPAVVTRREQGNDEARPTGPAGVIPFPRIQARHRPSIVQQHAGKVVPFATIKAHRHYI